MAHTNQKFMIKVEHRQVGPREDPYDREIVTIRNNESGRSVRLVTCSFEETKTLYVDGSKEASPWQGLAIDAEIEEVVGLKLQDAHDIWEMQQALDSNYDHAYMGWM